MQHLEVVSEQSVFNIAPLRVVIVETDPLLQVGLKHSLSTCPQLQVIDCFTHGRDSLQAMQLLNPDLVILNPYLPDMDGISVLEMLKAALPQLRVMVLSSDRSEQSIIRALLHGANTYCLKGINTHQLLMAIACIQDGAVYLDPQIAHCVIHRLDGFTWKGTNPESKTMLTARELDILQLIVKGKTNIEIAKALYLSPHTIKSHIRSIMNKFSVDDRVQVAVTALRAGLVKLHVA